jgi:1,4-alpha-glucan branching enzyme
MVTVHGSYVQFRFYRPAAKAVHLAGEFNAWRVDQLKMVPEGNGYWLAVLRLPPGSYRFRYLADGQWYTDYAAFGIEYGPNGPEGVVRVAPLHGPAATPAEAAEETASRPVEEVLPLPPLGRQRGRSPARHHAHAA